MIDYKTALDNYVYSFIKDLKGLLMINETNELFIKGLYFDYYISLDIKERIVLSKEDKKTGEKRYCRFYLEQNNTVTGDTDDSLLNEFYNLFIQKILSKELTRFYNELVLSEQNELCFFSSTHEANYKILKPEKNKLNVIYNEPVNNKIISLVLYKMPIIPNWFVISKNNNDTDTEVKRILTLFKETKINPIFNCIFQKRNINSLKLSQYQFNETTTYFTDSEQFLLNFLTSIGNTTKLTSK